MARDRVYTSSQYRVVVDDMKEKDVLGLGLVEGKDTLMLAVALGLANPTQLPNRVGLFLNTALKTTDKASDEWTITAVAPKDNDYNIYSDAVKEALTGYKEIKLDYIADLASRINGAEEDYRFLCYGTKDSGTDLYVVEVHDGLDSAEITKVSLFDLSAYAVSPKPAEKGADNSLKSPQTGNSGVAAVMALLLFLGLFGACVSVKQIVKKHD